MSLVCGVDPGLNGAFATYDTDTGGIIDCIDMPTWKMPVGKTMKTRVDAVEVMSHIEYMKMLGVELVVIEQVGGRPKQSASAAFVFGYCVGLIYQSCIACRLAIETVPPATWKRGMRVPGKKDYGDDADGAIMARADELFPEARGLFRGSRGGLRVDRAEAAMLAKFGGDFVLRSVNGARVQTAEWRMVYRNAMTGA